MTGRRGYEVSEQCGDLVLRMLRREITTEEAQRQIGARRREDTRRQLELVPRASERVNSGSSAQSARSARR